MPAMPLQLTPPSSVKTSAFSADDIKSRLMRFCRIGVGKDWARSDGLIVTALITRLHEDINHRMCLVAPVATAAWAKMSSMRETVSRIRGPTVVIRFVPEEL